jgi:hypothetical protein
MEQGVGEAATTSLALVLHELATSSLKYGALSCGTGTLDITTVTKGEQLELIWMERGGPEVKAPPEASGFGSTLVHRSAFRSVSLATAIYCPVSKPLLKRRPTRTAGDYCISLRRGRRARRPPTDRPDRGVLHRLGACCSVRASPRRIMVVSGWSALGDLTKGR